MIQKKHTTEKDIKTESFYLFNTLDGSVVLFDDDMSYPIRYGTINTVVPILQYFKTKFGQNFKLYQFTTSNKDGFKKDNSPKTINVGLKDFPSIGFPTFPVKKSIPKTDKNNLYYHFKIDSFKHILYDQLLDSSISYGSKLDVMMQYKNMPKDSIVYYFEKNKTTGFKMKISIKPKKEENK